MASDYKKVVLEGSPLLHHVVGTHLLIEAYLRKALTESLVKPEALITDQGPSFSTLVNICEATGLIAADLSRVIRAINILRNKYAHRMSFEASKEQVESLLSALREMENPFFISMVPGSEHELSIALASVAGWFQRQYGPISA